MNVCVLVPEVSMNVTPPNGTLIEGDTVSITCITDPPPNKYMLLSSLVSQKTYSNERFTTVCSVTSHSCSSAWHHFAPPYHHFDLLLPTGPNNNGKWRWKVHNSEHYSAHEWPDLSAPLEVIRPTLTKPQSNCTPECRLWVFVFINNIHFYTLHMHCELRWMKVNMYLNAFFLKCLKNIILALPTVIDNIECNSKSQIQVETGTNLTITCEATSSKSLHFVWMKVLQNLNWISETQTCNKR